MLQVCHWLRTHFGPSSCAGHDRVCLSEGPPNRQQQQQQHHSSNSNSNDTAATPTAEAAAPAAAATPSATATHDGRLSMIQSSAERADGRTCGAVVEKQEFRSQIRFKQTVSQSTPPSKAKLAHIQSVGKA